MNNNGFTKIPNAIIRLAAITPAERSAWCLIASLPKGYALSVAEACVTLGINPKTWRQCIAGLLRRGMITVESVPGHANAYHVTPAENWDTTPPKNWEYQKTAGVPKNGTPPLPKNGRGTHYNKKDLLKNNTTTITRTHARERLAEELLTDSRIELAMMQHHITEEQYRQMVGEILADWEFRDLPDSDYNLNHFSIVLRTVMAKQQRNNGTGQQTDGRADKDSTIAQLDRDTLTAMASLARKGQYIDKAPF